MKKRARLLITLILLLIVLIFVNYNWLDGFAVQQFDFNEKAYVVRVVDGDTIETDKGTVRLLGINTPEKGEKYYQEAKNYMSLLVSNKTVDLEKLKQDKDQYNRSLRYVFIDGKNVNLALIENGYANAYFPSGKDRYYEQFNNAWDECVVNGINSCEKSKDKCSECIKLIELNYEKQFTLFENTCEFECNLNEWTIKDEGRKKFTFSNYRAAPKSKFIVLVEKTNKENNKTTIYWQRSDYVWTQAGDSLFLRDEQGMLVLWERY